MFDKDPLRDDFLAQVQLINGKAEFTFDIDNVSSFDTPTEKKPDLYFVILDGNSELSRTPVWRNVSFLDRNPNTGDRTDLTKDFGNIEIRL